MSRLKLISASQLKVLAFLTMIIDHFAYFFYFLLNDKVYYSLRCIGRISMPIFAFLIYQGIKHTSNLSKYRKRILALAMITQILCVIMGVLAKNVVPKYKVNFFYELNILFSFYLSIHFISIMNYLLDEKNKKDGLTIFMGFTTLLAVLVVFMIIPIDHGIIPLLIISLLFILDSKRKNIVLLCVAFAALITVFALNVINRIIPIVMLVSIPILLMYNGQKGKNYSKVWYYFYPTHIILLYAIGIITYLYR